MTADPLEPSTLHGSLADPVLASIGFLNEVMGRYPDAISFAPGAPHPDFLTDLDIQKYVDRFVDHLVREEGHDHDRARRLLFEYGPSRGIVNGVVADALNWDHGITASPDQIVITVGAQEAMFLVLRALFGSADDVLAVTNPSFVGITGAARLLDIDAVPVAETATGIDLDRLARLCADRRVRACYVAPDFANPSGSRMTLDCRTRLLELAEREDFYVLEDNAYGFTATAGTGLPSLKALDRTGRVIHIGTFAKVCFPGARVGYVVADQRVGQRLLADELAALKTMVTVNTSPITQAVIGGMLLEHGRSLVELSRRKSELYQRNLTHLVDALDRHVAASGVTWNRPDGGFFVLMDLPIPVNPELLEVSAAKYGVLWTPMEQFYLDDSGRSQLRLSCSYLDPDEIERGVRRLATFLQKEIGA